MSDRACRFCADMSAKLAEARRVLAYLVNDMWLDIHFVECAEDDTCECPIPQDINRVLKEDPEGAMNNADNLKDWAAQLRHAQIRAKVTWPDGTVKYFTRDEYLLLSADALEATTVRIVAWDALTSTEVQ